MTEGLCKEAGEAIFKMSILRILTRLKQGGFSPVF